MMIQRERNKNGTEKDVVNSRIIFSYIVIVLLSWELPKSLVTVAP